MILAACEAQEAAEGPAIVRGLISAYDSSGVQIVTHPRAALSDVPQWHLAASPESRIGDFAEREEYLLFNVAGGVLLGDSAMAIANGGTHELRYYRRDGRHLVTAGGRGGGPGEFTVIAWIGMRPDGSVAAWDPIRRRITCFDADGKVVETIAVEGDWGIERPRMIGFLADSSFLIQKTLSVSELARAPEAETRDSATLLRYTPDGRKNEPIAKGPGRAVTVSEFEGSRVPLRIPFGRDTHAAITGPEIVFGTSDEFRIEVLDSRGRPVRDIRLDHEPRPLTADAIEAARQEYIDLTARAMARMPEQFRRNVAEGIQNLPSRETLPAFADLKGDRAGNIWVAGSSLPGADHVRWYIFDDDGRMRATLRIPANLRILDHTVDHLLTVRENELGVEFVELYRIERQ